MIDARSVFRDSFELLLVIRDSPSLSMLSGTTFVVAHRTFFGVFVREFGNAKFVDLFLSGDMNWSLFECLLWMDIGVSGGVCDEGISRRIGLVGVFGGGIILLGLMTEAACISFSFSSTAGLRVFSTTLLVFFALLVTLIGVTSFDSFLRFDLLFGSVYMLSGSSSYSRVRFS